jgi:bifunctional UDP-N-acetylglucosamine pyrophosphorylase/glucosamine-1-phosphate N-acetyltransferase
MDNYKITDAKLRSQKEREVQLKKAYKLIPAGVVVRDPQRLDIRGSLVCGKDVEIDINVVFEGDVLLEDGFI